MAMSYTDRQHFSLLPTAFLAAVPEPQLGVSTVDNCTEVISHENMRIAKVRLYSCVWLKNGHLRRHHMWDLLHHLIDDGKLFDHIRVLQHEGIHVDRAPALLFI